LETPDYFRFGYLVFEIGACRIGVQGCRQLKDGEWSELKTISLCIFFINSDNNSIEAEGCA